MVRSDIKQLSANQIVELNLKYYFYKGKMGSIKEVMKNMEVPNKINR